MASPSSWRARAPAVLPLVFLQGVATTCMFLPTFELIKRIECDRYGRRNGPHIPEIDLCSQPEVLDHFSKDVMIFTFISAFLGILVAGVYGRVSDSKGRRKALAIAAVVQLLSCVWGLITVSISKLQLVPLLMLVAVFQGLGGSSLVINAAHLAFIADSSSKGTRSSYFGLAVVTTAVGGIVGPFIVMPFISWENYAAFFGVTIVCWLAYILYLTYVLRETRFPGSPFARSTSASQAPTAEPVAVPTDSGPTRIIRSILIPVFEPLKLVLVNETLRWLAVIVFLMPISERLVGISTIRTILSKMNSDEGTMSAILVVVPASVARAVSLLLILPIFSLIYRRRFSLSKTTSASGETIPSERTPLLQDEEQTPVEGPSSAVVGSSEEPSNIPSASQDLVVARVSLLVDVVGSAWVSLMKTAIAVAIANAFYSLGAPAIPAIQSLVTLVAAPSEVGRILTGIAIVNLLSEIPLSPFSLRNWGKSIGVVPEFVFYIAVSLYLCCGVILAFLRPTRFVHAETN